MKKIVLISLLMLVFLSCQSTPDRKNYSTEECFAFADCLYRNEKNDKSVCAVLGEACRDSLKEKRTYDRLKFCKENQFGNMTEAECRLFLNQK
jgi:hypothetical protein